MSAGTPVAEVHSGSGSITVPSGVQGGDLIEIHAYMEPANESSGTATYGTVTGPSGFTAAAFSPLNSNDGNLTSQDTQRHYVWYKYAAGTVGSASTDVSTAFTVSSTAGVYVETLMLVTRISGVTSGVPYAETPSTVTYSHGSGDVSAWPATSLTTGGVSLLRWVGTAWSAVAGSLAGWTSDFSNDGTSPMTALHLTQSTAGATGNITPAPSASTSLLTAVLVSYRSASGGTNYTASPADAEGITDSASWTLTPGSGTAYVFTVADGVGVTDTGSPQSIGYGVAFADAEGITDAIVTLLNRGVNGVDAVGITDSFTYVYSFGDLFAGTDSESITDVAVFTINPGGTEYTFEVDDGIGLLDLATLLGPPRDITIVVSTGSDRWSISTSEI